MRQMSYSLCRFWAYDESKKIVGAGASGFISIGSRDLSFAMIFGASHGLATLLPYSHTYTIS
jgi:hypothetical protein